MHEGGRESILQYPRKFPQDLPPITRRLRTSISCPSAVLPDTMVDLTIQPTSPVASNSSDARPIKGTLYHFSFKTSGCEFAKSMQGLLSLREC